MAAAKLGDARCPLCGGTARVSLSKSNYAVLTMNCCNAQLFTRSPRSDELVRDLIRPAVPGSLAPAPAAQAPVPAPKPATPAVAPPIAAPVAARETAGFGLGWFTK